MSRGARLIAIDGPVAIGWQLSSYFGWGVYGVNLLLNWSLQQKGLLLTTMPVRESVIDLDPLEWSRIHPALEVSRELQVRLDALHRQHVSVGFPMLHALGNSFAASPSTMHGRVLFGKPNLGVTFFESTSFSAERRELAKFYPLIIAGSSWNQAVIEEAGIGPTALVLQGIDPTAFHPAPKANLFAGRFAVFSGGKLEYRKGQDLVLKAFRAFATRHPDALLVTAWGSPFSGAARTLDEDETLAAVTFRPDGKADIAAWAAANGIAADQFLDLGELPNGVMPKIYREMNVGLFPNRCEGGTNLVAMECMACGVPVILSRNTGHLDLIATDRCFALNQQTSIEGEDRLGWGESSVDEMVETLEAVRRDAADRAERGKRGAEFMRALTWSETAKNLATAIAPYL